MNAFNLEFPVQMLANALVVLTVRRVMPIHNRLLQRRELRPKETNSSEVTYENFATLLPLLTGEQLKDAWLNYLIE